MISIASTPHLKSAFPAEARSPVTSDMPMKAAEGNKARPFITPEAKTDRLVEMRTAPARLAAADAAIEEGVTVVQ